MSLAGRKILICASRNLSPAILNALMEKGARPVHVPLFSARLLVAEELSRPLAALQDLSQYDGVVLSSTNGVDFFLQLCRENRIQIPANVKFGLVGKKTEQQFFGYFPALPAEFVAENLQALIAEIERTSPGQLQRWVHFTSKESLKKIRVTTPDWLELQRLPIYGLAPEPFDPELNPEALVREADAILFTSPSSVDFLLKSIPAGSELQRIRLFAMGPSSAMHMKSAGLTVSRTAPKPTAEEISKMLADFYDTNSSKFAITHG